MVQLDRIKLDEKDYNALIKFRRAACYIAAGMSPAGIDGRVYTNDSVAMIFLQDNVYLKRDLKPDDIKPRLLGKKYQISTRRRYLTRTEYRSLGNMSRPHSCLFASELPDQEI
jgi:hypothetical protein